MKKAAICELRAASFTIKIKRIFCFLSLFLTLNSQLSTRNSFASDFSSSAKGTTSAGFLKLAAGARAAALGEAYAAMANDATALYWNPAALTRLPRKSASFMHALHLDSSFFDYAAYGQPIKWKSSKQKTSFAKNYVGFALQYFSAGAITQTDETGTPTGSFTPNDLAFTAGYGKKLGTYSIGANAKLVRSTIDDTAQTIAVDLGFLSPAHFSGLWRYGLSVSNLGGSLQYGSGSAESLPLIIRWGNAFRLGSSWSAALDVAAPKDNAPYWALGTEYYIPMGGRWNLSPRAGYNTRSSDDLGGLSGISFGFGTGTSALGFDYAFVPFGDLGITHRLSFSVGF
ncbi:MAG: PorV/PorQ family protein [Elusimicrobia bacterium]|nr:PorV/PorQ family protein [Elusimicrobiota bacterium]